jgi:hypothetical protein
VKRLVGQPSLEGHSHLDGVEKRLGLARGVTLVLELFAIHSFDLLGVACNRTSRSNPRINFVHHSFS